MAGIWVIHDIGPLRQITDTVARADAYLFKPAAAVNVMQGSDNGTPTQKDEPQAANPPNGASIDYYLRTAATGPVTIEIQDAGGACLALFTSDPATAPACAGAAGGRGAAFGRGGGTGIPNTSALWRPAPEPFARAQACIGSPGRPAVAAVVADAGAWPRCRPARSRRR